MNIDNIIELKELINICADTEKNKHIDLMWFHVGRKNKIPAIKEYRSATGKDLKDSKAYVDKLFYEYNPE